MPGATQQPVAGETQTQMAKAKALRDSGASDEAQKIYQAILPTLRARGPSLELATALDNLSDIANSAGDYDQAVTLAAESIQVCQKLGDKNCEAKARNDAGFAYMNSGRYSEAGAQLEPAVKLATDSGDAQTLVLVLNNLGNVHYYEAKYSDSFRRYEQAMQILEKPPGQLPAAYWRNVTQANLATLYLRVGNYRRAAAIYEGILESSQAQGLSAREVAQMHVNLGVAFRRLGDIHNTLVNYEQAERSYALEKDADGEIGVLKNRGIVEVMNLDKPQDALKTFERARQRAEKTGNRREVMQIMLYRGETLRRMGRLAEAQQDLDAALADAGQLDTVEEQWKALYGLGQIALAQRREEVAEQKFREAVNRIESLRFKLQLSRLRTDFLADKRDVYDALIKLLLDRNDHAAALEFMERSRARNFQDRFWGNKVAPSSLTLAAIQQKLTAGSALIEFWTGPDAVAAVWVTHDTAGVAVKRLTADEAARLPQSISALPDNLGPDWRSDFQKIVASLPSGVAPFSDARYPHLLIVPDGYLSLAPFELLASSQGHLVLEGHDVTYLPSAVLLFRGAAQKPTFAGPWQTQLLGFGDPSVVAGGESALLGTVRADIGQLPASGEEVRAIARMSAGRAKLFLGPKDIKAGFFDSTRAHASLLHVSTHAFADQDNPERSRLLFSPDAPGELNNYLFLKELYDLDLRSLDLATLSACDTERGRLVPGEGIQAFSRALLSAGSRSTLTTLWRVPDQPTAEFMKQFYYFLLKQHKSKAEALRLTKLEFLRSGTELSHPRYWAAFVLNGDGMEPVPKFISWQAVALPALLLIAGAAMFWQFRSRRKLQARTQ